MGDHLRQAGQRRRPPAFPRWPDQSEQEPDRAGHAFLNHTVPFGCSRKTLERKCLRDEQSNSRKVRSLVKQCATSHQGIGWRSWKKAPVGPPSASVASHTIVSVPCSTDRGAPEPPISVRTHPGSTAFTRTLLPRAASATMRVSALRARGPKKLVSSVVWKVSSSTSSTLRPSSG